MLCFLLMKCVACFFEFTRRVYFLSSVGACFGIWGIGSRNAIWIGLGSLLFVLRSCIGSSAMPLFGLSVLDASLSSCDRLKTLNDSGALIVVVQIHEVQ